MAYLSRQCVECSDQTKRCEGEYRGRDEQGKPFSGPMYQCSNAGCRINQERIKGEKQLHTMEVHRYPVHGRVGGK